MAGLKSYAVLLMLAFLMFLGGCSTHKVRGAVVAGKIPGIEVVDDDDERLVRNGINEAVVSSILEPRGMHPELLPQVQTDEQGKFSIPVDRFGAGGLQEYDINLVAQAYGYSATEKTIKVPWSHKRVLITVVPGRDTYEKPNDFLRDTLKMKEQFLK